MSNHFANRILQSGQRYIDAALRNRGQRVAFVVAALICFAVSVAFNVFEWLSGTPWPVAVTFAYQLVVITGFALAWFLLSYYLKRRPIGPLKTFWTTLLLALLAAAVIRLMVGITAPENVDVNPALLGFGYDTGVPLTFATVVKMHVVSSLRALLAFYLLLRFQDLVLFKRTKQSQRNWYLMLISMGVFSLVAILKDPAEDPGRVQFVALMPVIILMILNAFRVSWIVFLSFRAKAAGVGFSILLILLLGASLSPSGILPAHFMYIRHASYPLDQFTLAALAFGLLYCVTSFLFLIFHLPTTGDFRRKSRGSHRHVLVDAPRQSGIRSRQTAPRHYENPCGYGHGADSLAGHCGRAQRLTPPTSRGGMENHSPGYRSHGGCGCAVRRTRYPA